MSAITASLSEMDGVIEEWKRTHPETLRKPPRERASIILKNRLRFVAALGKIHEELKTDPRLAANADLAQEFAGRLSQVRKDLGELQTKWRIADVEKDYEGYAVASSPFAEGALSFVRWAKDAYLKG